MLLLEAESAWACAMELKAGMEAAGRVHTNQRRHMLRRFTKARKAAAELQSMASKTANVFTAAACDTYFLLAQALELAEKVQYRIVVSMMKCNGCYLHEQPD
jgi:3-keto-L-gulonate-6-phosphate decarboxylase